MEKWSQGQGIRQTGTEQGQTNLAAQEQAEMQGNKA